MSKCKHKAYKNLGLIVASIGIGIIITVLLPIWGFVIAVGGGLIYVGWYLIDHYK